MGSFEHTVDARHQALLAAIPDLMFRLRSDGTYLEFAGDMSRLATPHEALLGSNMFDILPGEVAGTLMHCVAAAVESGELRTVEYELPTLAGELRQFEARVVPIPEHPDEVVAIVRDVSEQHRAEQELVESRARLVSAGEQERRRLERDLHDGAQHRLLTANLHLHVVRRSLESNPERAAEALGTAQAELAGAITEIRELVRGLQPAVLAADGLGPAIAALAERAAQRVEIVELPDERLDEPLERALYYFVAEALANAAKHAQATTVTVRISTADGAAVAEVADDGVGGAKAASDGGLAGLRERIARVDGELTIESAPGSGTHLRARIPLSAAATG
jgi:PAS domain S-box-containing protein